MPIFTPSLFRSLAVAVVALALASPVLAQPSRTLSDDPWCNQGGTHAGGRERACEIRETVLTARPLTVTPSRNGGVEVQVWDRPDVLLRAVVAVWAPSATEAQQRLGAVQIETSGSIRLRSGDSRDVAVSFRLYVPRESDITLTTVNGGVTVSGVHGTVRIQAQNGGVSLVDVGGDVRARAQNGGLSVRLAGSRWEGRGLDVEAANGGVSLTMPADYSAALDARTQNGGVSVNGLTGVSVERGRYAGGRVVGTLGRGGPPVRAVTANGGLSITRG